MKKYVKLFEEYSPESSEDFKTSEDIESSNRAEKCIQQKLDSKIYKDISKLFDINKFEDFCQTINFNSWDEQSNAIEMSKGYDGQRGVEALLINLTSMIYKSIRENIPTSSVIDFIQTSMNCYKFLKYTASINEPEESLVEAREKYYNAIIHLIED